MTFNSNRGKRFFYALGMLLAAILFSLGLTGGEESGDSCISDSCHGPLYLEGLNSSSPHTPFNDRQCETCHFEATTGLSGTYEPKSIIQPVVLSQSDYQTEHIVLLKGLAMKAVYDVYVTLTDTSGNHVRKEYRSVVPEEINDVRTDDKMAPEISEVDVAPVSKGVFLETTVTWNTDELSTSRVEYGLSDQYGHHTSENSTLVGKHVVSIYELVDAKNYHFRVISRDIFGNESVSKDYQFSTATAFPLDDSSAETADNGNDNSLVIIKSEIFLMDSDIGVYVGMSRPARITIELLKMEDPVDVRMVRTASVVVQETTDTGICPNNEVLRQGKDLMIEACYQCHPPEELGISHPVGMEPSGKTKIPTDLPTLPGGVMTCNTCHFPHGGSRPYLARKDLSEEICVTCHEGY